MFNSLVASVCVCVLFGSFIGNRYFESFGLLSLETSRARSRGVAGTTLRNHYAAAFGGGVVGAELEA